MFGRPAIHATLTAPRVRPRHPCRVSKLTLQPWGWIATVKPNKRLMVGTRPMVADAPVGQATVVVATPWQHPSRPSCPGRPENRPIAVFGPWQTHLQRAIQVEGLVD